MCAKVYDAISEDEELFLGSVHPITLNRLESEGHKRWSGWLPLYAHDNTCYAQVYKGRLHISYEASGCRQLKLPLPPPPPQVQVMPRSSSPLPRPPPTAGRIPLLLDHAQARAPFPPLWGVIRVAYCNV